MAAPAAFQETAIEGDKTMNEITGFPAPGRRVVAGINTSGKSAILSDGPVPKDATFSEPEVASGGISG
jgi:hypothetical protein